MEEEQAAGDDLVLAWPRPAANWFEAAPVGNGRLGAMVFGGPGRSRLQVNDSTVWSGRPQGPADALAAVLASGAGPERLAEVRQAVRDEDHRRAEDLLMSFEGDYSQEYLPFFDLWATVEADGDAAYLGRTLNLDDGVAGEAFELGGRSVRRRIWASRPARAVCVEVTVEGGTADMRLEASSPLREVHRAADASGLTLGVEVPVDGAPMHEPDVAEPLRYAASADGGYDPFAAAAVRVATDGEVSASDGVWSVRGMSRALIVITSSTSAADYWANPADEVRSASREDHLARAVRDAEAAVAAGAAELLRAHRRDLRGLLSPVRLTIGDRRAGTFDVEKDILTGEDEGLVATVMFQLGRYLLASSSRPAAGPPANLQGIWNADMRPPWSSNYTININTQMNYWGAESAGLPECHEPLFDLIERLARTGGRVSRELYGARGWVTHHNTDMWGWSLPVGMGHGNPSWAIWMMGGVWLAHHLWEHFEFGQDLEFLRDRGWPLLRGSAEFCLDWLVDGPDGRLDTIPSTSPENLFVSRQGTPESLSYSTAMDMALIRALFSHCLEAADALALDDPILDRIRTATPRLRPPQIAPDGRLREWAEDHPEQDPHHRHLSFLASVYPLGQIDPVQTPDLAAAAVRSMDARGPGAMGWSWAWKIALRARLGDARTARDLFLEATRPYSDDPEVNLPVDGSLWGGLLPNLFSTHPPFQIDGNYGFTAALLEMVVQSHGGVIGILPALPREWDDGSVRGVRCRGGWIVGLDWRRGGLTSLTLRNALPGTRTVRVRLGDETVERTLAGGEEVLLGPSLDIREKTPGR
ncbi:glycoside hydrolase family 95 protein [Planotetraspora phitsanulokensis]|uniref:Alpha/beta hydrolase n=1 Tax=Planotetraspora phitsanulokensis TaxID=575192 RepID=A0A8J3U0X9_9ACTN|nr:glycoside hydrolase N-terminal domain-containing protein [Planotetraspora phitsanulokensis]GII36478.1 alpha/beta hydrolase [Planotetraspora phitsanulokensis]